MLSKNDFHEKYPYVAKWGDATWKLYRKMWTDATQYNLCEKSFMADVFKAVDASPDGNITPEQKQLMIEAMENRQRVATSRIEHAAERAEYGVFDSQEEYDRAYEAANPKGEWS